MGTFFGGPVIKTLRFHCIEHGSIPDQETKIPHAMWQKTKKKRCGGGQRKNVRNQREVQSQNEKLAFWKGKQKNDGEENYEEIIKLLEMIAQSYYLKISVSGHLKKAVRTSNTQAYCAKIS